MKVDFVRWSGLVLALATLSVHGQSLYDTSSQVCCNNGVALDAPKGTDASSLSCCGTQTYIYSKKTCCNGKLYDVDDTSDTYKTCCGDQYVALTSNQTCCNNVIITNPGSGSYYCCGSKTYNYNTQLCCNNNVIQKSANSSYGFSCCGNNSYNYNTQTCCFSTGKVLDKPKSQCSAGSSPSCCNDQLIAPQQQCCNNQIINPSSVLIKTGSYNYTSTSYCCGQGGGIIQNSNKEMCCGNTVMPRTSPNSACCGSSMYDTTTQMCCGSSLYTNHNSDGVYCCGSSLYNSFTQICCQNVPLNKTNPNMACCYNSSVIYY